MSVSEPAAPSSPELPSHPHYPRTLGATPLGNGRCRFVVWASKADSVTLRLLDPERMITMEAKGRGYFQTEVDNCPPGTKYFFRIDAGPDRPDPVSRWQPDGVHNASAVVHTDFDWSDAHWRGLPLCDYITYELHIGTFTPEGTFDSAIGQLDRLVDLGITAIELLPVAQFPGGRNWGYDGVHPFAPQNTYGGPDGLRRFVDACHARGIAVIMDVVYNHLGPEGNYLGEFALYFSPKYNTPWGAPLNFDGPHSDEVKRYFIENALHWISEYHIDALRLDAVHAIYDYSARHFLGELAQACRDEGRRLNRHVFTIAESALNDRRMLTTEREGGFGVDGQWADDLHHVLHTLLTGERGGYYADYDGYANLAQVYDRGFVYDGQRSDYRKARYGNSVVDLDPERFVVFSQNHDQVGNRMLGERLSNLVSFDKQKVAAAAVLLSPYSPMLFMGEEYGETAPFLYFTSHTDENLIRGVREGRKREFEQFHWDEEPPDPQAEETFRRCVLNPAQGDSGQQASLLNLYRELIRLRKSRSSLRFPARERFSVEPLDSDQVLILHADAVPDATCLMLNCSDREATVSVSLPAGRWTRLLDTSEERFGGAGSPVPEAVESSGRIAFRLASWSVAALGRDSVRHP